jgi:type I restriction enzyme S subunit
MKQFVSEDIETPFDLPETPEGWQITLMEQISQIIGGGTPKTSDNGNFSKDGYRWITPADLSGFSGMYIERGKRSLSERGLKTSSAVLMPKGTVLMSSRAPIGYLAIAANELCTNQGFKSFICHQGVVPEYVFFWLRFITPFLENMGSGSTFMEISGSRARKIPILLAPTLEQKRIVAKVEELLPRVNATKKRLAKVSVILKRFRQAVLSAACSGRLTDDWRNGKAQLESGQAALQLIFGNKTPMKVPSVDDPFEPPEIPEQWTWTRCEFLCEPERIITYGVIKLGPNTKNGIGTLRSSDVRWLYIENDNVKCISPKIAARYSRTFLKGGEILITVRGSLGGVAVVPKEMAGCNISREVAMLPLHPELNPQFFSYAIASIWSQNWLSEVTKGVAYTGINIRDLKRLPLPVPPIAEQHEIIRRVESMFNLADAVEKRVEATKVRAQKLTQAILAKAFRGRLVSTEAEFARREGRSYEPASELLSRIKSECEASRNSKSDRRYRVNKKIH